MQRPMRHKVGLTLALAATAGLGGCSMYGGYGGHSGYGGYTRASSADCGSGYYRVSGGAEEFLVYAVFYGGVVLVAGIVELLEQCVN
jgi:hypothetical protein